MANVFDSARQIIPSMLFLNIISQVRQRWNSRQCPPQLESSRKTPHPLQPSPQRWARARLCPEGSQMSHWPCISYAEGCSPPGPCWETNSSADSDPIGRIGQTQIPHVFRWHSYCISTKPIWVWELAKWESSLWIFTALIIFPHHAWLTLLNKLMISWVSIKQDRMNHLTKCVPHCRGRKSNTWRIKL